MLRLAFVIVYLVAMGIGVILIDAGTDLEGWGALIWAVASVALGLGTGRFSFVLLAFLAVPFAVPFGYPNNYEFSEPLPTWFSMVFLSVYSAGLILLSVLANRGVQLYRRRRAAA